MNDYMSLKALYELQLLREEMKKDNPDPERISNLLCGDKYNIPIRKMKPGFYIVKPKDNDFVDWVICEFKTDFPDENEYEIKGPFDSMANAYYAQFGF